MQRIALCYLAVALFAVLVPHRYTLPTIVGLLLLYTAILLLGNGYAYDATTNILAQTDLQLFGYNHLYHKSPVDPEGLLSTLPAIAHTLIGFLLGRQMLQATDTPRKVRLFLMAGLLMAVLGLALSPVLPPNKRIWSPSYVLLTCGLAALLQGGLMFIIDQKQHGGAWTKPLLYFGCNPLFLYVASELLAILFGTTNIKEQAYNAIASLIANPYNASLTYALLFTLLHALMGYLLYRKRIFIKL